MWDVLLVSSFSSRPILNMTAVESSSEGLGNLPTFLSIKQMSGLFKKWTQAIQILNPLNITKIPKNPGNLPSRQILGVWILLLTLVLIW